MVNTVRVAANLALHGSLNFEVNASGFPANPKLGTLYFKGGVLYGYQVIGGLETWYPLTNATKSYVHTQGLESLIWTVTHNLGSLNTWFQVQDAAGSPIYCSRTVVDENSFTLTFTEAAVGSVVIVGPDNLNVPAISTSLLTATSVNIADGTVVLSAGAATLRGSDILTVADLGSGTLFVTPTQMDARIQQVVGAAPAALDTLEELGARLVGEETAVDSLITQMAGKASTSSLAPVALSGSFLDLSDRPPLYFLPFATATVLGGVKQGNNITIAADGTINALSSGAEVAGANTQIQYNNNGSLGASTKLAWNEVSGQLQLGDGSINPTITSMGGLNTGMTLYLAGSQATSGLGGNGGGVGIYASPANIAGSGGNVTLEAGAASGTGNNAGSVIIAAGVGALGTTPAANSGAIVFKTGSISTIQERLRILNNGAWSVGSNGTSYGTAGQVLTSSGNGAPSWAAPIAGPVGTSTQIPYNKSGVMGADSSLAWIWGSNTLSLGNGNDFASITSVGGAAGRDLYLKGSTSASGSGSAGGVRLVGASSSSLGSGGNLSLNAGNSSGANRSAGNVEIAAGIFPAPDGSTPYVDSGYISITTGAGVRRLTVTHTGAWSVGSSFTNYGTAGQVLTSNGNGTPSWQNPVAATASTLANATVIGTTSAAMSITGISSTAAVFALSITGSSTSLNYAVGGGVVISGGTNTSATSGIGGSVTIKGGAGLGQNAGGDVTISGGTPGNSTGTSSTVLINGADSVANTASGNVTVRAGNNGPAAGTGVVLISGTTTSRAKNAAWTAVTITGGQTGGGVFETAYGGDVVISAGKVASVDALAATGGNLKLNGGTVGTGTTVIGGAIVLSTAASTTLTERVRILPNGAWSVGSDGTSYGTEGKVLTSHGNAPPSWQDLSMNGDTVAVKTFTGAVTCNYTTEGAYVAATVTGATTLTIAGVPDATKAYGMTFELTNAGTNVTWPASVVWLGTAPTLRASGVSMVTLVTRNGGTTWYGSAA